MIEFVRRFRDAKRTTAITLALTALVISASLLGAKQPARAADTGGGIPTYVFGHTYVAYTADWTPSPQGMLVDVTTQLTVDDDQGHVHDLHGNDLTIDGSTGAVYDADEQQAGFVYAGP